MPPADHFETAVTGGTVVAPPHPARRMTLGIDGGRVTAVLAPERPVTADQVIDARGRYVLPGVIDPHVHIGYSGYQGMPTSALADQFDTESRSALIGGVTSIVVTYRNSDPYDEIFEVLRGAGEQNSRVDFAYSLGITSDEHLRRLPVYHDELGVTSFKFYMVYRGEEAQATGNTYNRYDDGLLYVAMETIARWGDAIAMVHPENVEIIDRLRERLRNEGRSGLAAWSDARPAFTEAENVRRALYLGEQVGCPVYIPHLSAAASLDAVIEHRARRSNAAHVETCPHYLTHTKDSAYGSLAKVNPPLRADDDRDRLWSAIARGDVDTIGTDHCAVAAEDKGSDIWSAVPGFPGMSTLLPVLLDGVCHGRLTLGQVAEVCSLNTARIFGLYPRKGTLEVGSDADLAIVDLDHTRTVTADRLRSRSDFSIYEGQSLTGWPTLTMVGGRVAMSDGEIVAPRGTGRYLPRGPAAAPAPAPAKGNS